MAIKNASYDLCIEIGTKLTSASYFCNFKNLTLMLTKLQTNNLIRFTILWT